MHIYEYCYAVEQSGKKLLGVIEAYKSSPTGTFFSQNMASQYLILVLSATSVKFISNLKIFLQTKQGFAKTAIFAIYLLVNVLTLLLCLQVQALLGIAILVGLLVVQIFYISGKLKKCILIALANLALIAVFIGFAQGNQWIDTFETKLINKIERKIESNLHENDRIVLWGKSIDILKNNKCWGVGANNFIFYSYQYDDKYYTKKHPHRTSKSIAYSVHNDLLQFMCEFGIIGTLILLTGIIYYLTQTIKNIRSNYLYINILLGIITIAIISLFDMPFQLINVSTLFFIYCAIIHYKPTQTN